jgi:4-hydroxybutyrate CoA-transferase
MTQEVYSDLSWKETYQSKLKTMTEAVSLIESNDVIITQNGVSMPYALIDAMYDIRDRVENVQLNLGATKKAFKVFNKECNGKINIRTNCLYPGEREAIKQGSHLGILLLDLHDTYADKLEVMRPNVAIAGVTPPDANGYFSLGLHSGDIPQMKGLFDKIIVQVNKHLPYVNGKDHFLHVDDVTAIVEHDDPLQQIPTKEPNALDEIIAGYIVERIPDGATLQFGIGGPGMVVGRNLKHKHDLGIHTELLSDTMVDLIRCGAVNNSKKHVCRGKTVFGFAQGNQDTYDFIDHNPDFECRSYSWVNDPYIIGQNDNVVSVNAALAMDLTGQVCAESKGLQHYSGTGGHCDFVRGAHISKGGQSFIAFYSTYKKKDGTPGSKIDITLPLGSAVSTRRNDVHYVVTEYGIVNLRYRTIEERVKAMISIAHPDFRDQLTFQAKKEGLLY